MQIYSRGWKEITEDDTNVLILFKTDIVMENHGILEIRVHRKSELDKKSI